MNVARGITSPLTRRTFYSRAPPGHASAADAPPQSLTCWQLAERRLHRDQADLSSFDQPHGACDLGHRRSLRSSAEHEVQRRTLKRITPTHLAHCSGRWRWKLPSADEARAAATTSTRGEGLPGQSRRHTARLASHHSSFARSRLTASRLAPSASKVGQRVRCQFAGMLSIACHASIRVCVTAATKPRSRIHGQHQVWRQQNRGGNRLCQASPVTWRSASPQTPGPTTLVHGRHSRYQAAHQATHSYGGRRATTRRLGTPPRRRNRTSTLAAAPAPARRPRPPTRKSARLI